MRLRFRKCDFMDIEPLGINTTELGQREKALLQIIVDENLSNFTFDGLKRKSRLHPETLSRILDRLEDEGILTRMPGLDGRVAGYAVTSSAKRLLRMNRLSSGKTDFQLLKTLVPPHVSAREILPDLIGRWFGALRWLGYSEDESGVVLKWISEDGIQLDAVFSNGELRITTRLEKEEALGEALRLAYQLIGNIARRFSRADWIKPVGYFYEFYPHMMAA